jgi:hypothetical protein
MVRRGHSVSHSLGSFFRLAGDLALDGRPHSALGPGIPADAKERLQRLTPHTWRQELPEDSRITTREILGGLHHEYELERTAA